MRHRDEAGFTLMETLVAFAIFSLAIVAILQSFSASSRAQVRAQASIESGELLARVMASAEARLDGPGEVQGEEGGLRWHLSIAPAGNDLLAITAQVEDGFGRNQSASTIRWRGELFPKEGL